VKSALAAVSGLPFELIVRAKLSERFDREFPTMESYARAAEAAKPQAIRLAEPQIIRSLIGKSVGGIFDQWTFEDPREIVSLNVQAVTNPSETVADYDVQTHVKGIQSGNERDFHLRLTYHWFFTRWILVQIIPIQ
jgi:hypothetical protein